MNHAPRKAVTAHQTKRRRPSLAALGSGPTVARPPAAAAFDVPTAGVPTYFVASAPPVAEDFAASGLGPSALGLTVSDSGPAMHTLLNSTSYSKFFSGSCLSAFPLRAYERCALQPVPVL